MTISKINKGLRFVIMLAAGMIGASWAHASSVSYYLNNTNVSQLPGGLPDGTNYLTVKIDDEGTPGLINFTVDVIYNFTQTENFGIQNFALNITGDAIPLTTGNIVNLPSGWGATLDSNADGYGNFDVLVGDGGQNRKDPLTFSINVDGDTINSYFAPSAGNAGQGNAWFAAHVTGISTGAYTLGGSSEGSTCAQESDGCVELSSAWFGSLGEGGGPPAGIVPVPAAVWLFGSGLLGLVGVARRRKGS